MDKCKFANSPIDKYIRGVVYQCGIAAEAVQIGFFRNGAATEEKHTHTHTHCAHCKTGAGSTVRNGQFFRLLSRLDTHFRQIVRHGCNHLPPVPGREEECWKKVSCHHTREIDAIVVFSSAAKFASAKLPPACPRATFRPMPLRPRCRKHAHARPPDRKSLVSPWAETVWLTPVQCFQPVKCFRDRIISKSCTNGPGFATSHTTSVSPPAAKVLILKCTQITSTCIYVPTHTSRILVLISVLLATAASVTCRWSSNLPCLDANANQALLATSKARYASCYGHARQDRYPCRNTLNDISH